MPRVIHDSMSIVLTTFVLNVAGDSMTPVEHQECVARWQALQKQLAIVERISHDPRAPDVTQLIDDLAQRLDELEREIGDIL